MPTRSWGSYGFPRARDHQKHEAAAAAAASDGMSDSDLDGFHFKRPKFLSQVGARSRSSSPGGSSPRTPQTPRTPQSWDSSPRASNASSESHWSLSPKAKVLNLSKSFGSRLGFNRRSSSSRKQEEEEREAEEAKSPRRLPMLLDDLPTDAEEREEYMTVIVGERNKNRETFVINKILLTHHLFQTLMKCSEDMAGPPESRRNSLSAPLFCEPALFLHLVHIVGATIAAESDLA